MVGCYITGDSQHDQQCSAVAECAERTGCNQADCYCGKGVECGRLIAPPAPVGPCKAEISSAANSMMWSQITSCTTTATCPLYGSRNLVDCRMKQCAAECAPDAAAPAGAGGAAGGAGAGGAVAGGGGVGAAGGTRPASSMP
jgi:hypothetical protein